LHVKLYSQYGSVIRYIQSKWITHRTLIAVFASVCRRFLKYLFWYFWSSAIVPLSACILFGDILSLLSPAQSRMVVTDVSESLDESDNGRSGDGCWCCVWFWLNLILETFIFGDGVNTELPDDEVGVQSFDEKLLTLLLQFAFKFIRLSFCTLFSTTRIDEYCFLYGKYVIPWPFSSSSSSSIWGSVDGKWLCDVRDADDKFDDDDCCCCCWGLDVFGVDWLMLPVGEDVDGATNNPVDVVVIKFCWCKLLVEEVDVEVGELAVVTIIEEELVEEDKEAPAVGNWFKALVSATNDGSRGCDGQMLSDNSGVVRVGEDADIVTDDVVIPINVVVTIVSISGDESAVNVVYVGVCVGAVDGVTVPPPVDNFLSNLLLLSPGADGPPRQGKQQRNSVERNIVTRFHDYFLLLEILYFIYKIFQYISFLFFFWFHTRENYVLPQTHENERFLLEISKFMDVFRSLIFQEKERNVQKEKSVIFTLMTVPIVSLKFEY